MPRKRKSIDYSEDPASDETSEWEQDEDEGGLSSDEDLSDADKNSNSSSDDDVPVPDLEPTPKKKALKQKTSLQPRKRKAIPADELPELKEYIYESADDDALPSSARITARGGYSHTQKSRLKISKANKGNVPWNKGQNRSDTVRSKIAAGVRARNRERLLVKLAKIGMTEDEYQATMKEVKYVRERVRRAKLVTKKHKAMLSKLRRSKTVSYACAPVSGYIEELSSEREESADPLEEDDESESKQEESDETDEDMEDNETAAAVPAESHRQDETSNDMECDGPTHPMFAMFVPEIEWSPHPFDDSQSSVSYANICPNGGPGGLICCSVCSATYSKYLSTTFKDVEAQSDGMISHELEELVKLTNDTKVKLRQATRAARKKAPPQQTRQGQVDE